MKAVAGPPSPPWGRAHVGGGAPSSHPLGSIHSVLRGDICSAPMTSGGQPASQQDPGLLLQEAGLGSERQ